MITLFTKNPLLKFTRDIKNKMIPDQFRHGTHELHTYPTNKGEIHGVLVDFKFVYGCAVIFDENKSCVTQSDT